MINQWIRVESSFDLCYDIRQTEVVRRQALRGGGGLITGAAFRIERMSNMKLGTPGYIPPYMKRNGAFEKLQPIWTKDMYQFLLSGVGVYLVYRLFTAMAEGLAETGAYQNAGWFTQVLTWFVEQSGPVWVISVGCVAYLLLHTMIRAVRLRNERWWTPIFLLSLFVYDALMLFIPILVIFAVKSMISLCIM